MSHRLVIMGSGPAAQTAAGVPLETAAAARRVLGDLNALRGIGNPNLKADVEAAIALARAAILAAAANVEANIGLAPEVLRAGLRGELARLTAI